MKTETVILPEMKKESGSTSVAPWWHTALLILFYLAVAAAGVALQHRVQGRPHIVAHRPNMIPIYISVIGMTWGLIYYVWKGGIRRRGITALQLIGGRWPNLKAVLVDILLALGTWLLWLGIEFCRVWFMGPSSVASISPMLPHGAVEDILWVMVSISGGISEEFVFRGYLQRQLTALTGSVSVAFILQTLLFGITHSYQGVQICFAIALYGALFTLLALWRKSLRPGMIAHAWSDIAAGLLR
jgi:membrane protease YdiL (CAAX protease family)